jgi:hypothetical protein
MNCSLGKGYKLRWTSCLCKRVEGTDDSDSGGPLVYLRELKEQMILPPEIKSI